MALIRNIVKSILPPEDTAEMWLDGEGKLRAYTLGVWKEVSATEVNSEEVIKASQSYPYNITIPDISIKDQVFEGDLLIVYELYKTYTNMRLFAEGSFLANHVKKVNIMGFDVEDMESLPSILMMIRDTYDASISIKFTLDTDTIEGDLFGINYIEDADSPKPTGISANVKVKSLDCSHTDTDMNISMLNSPTEILEQGSIKGSFFMFALPLVLKNLEENAFAKYSTTEGGDEIDCKVSFLFMPSLTVPESLPQSLSLTPFFNNQMLYFPALIGERTYKDYVADVFNIDVTTPGGAGNVYCLDVSTGKRIIYPTQEQEGDQT